MNGEHYPGYSSESESDQTSAKEEVWQAPKGVLNRSSTDEMFEGDFGSILSIYKSRADYSEVVDELKAEYHRQCNQSGYQSASNDMYPKLIKAFQQNK